MNRLQRLPGVLLEPTGGLKQMHVELEAAQPTEDPKQVHAELGAAGVPVSFVDCRNCPNPCEDGKRTIFSISLDALTRASQDTRSIREE